MIRTLVLPALLLALPLAAGDWPGPDTLGVQVRADVPSGNLADAADSSAPGVGASLQAEIHFDPSLVDAPLAVRLELGGDEWSKPGTSSMRAVREFHLGGEVVYFLRDDRSDLLKGPYLLAGIRGAAWSLGASASGTGSSLRVVHAAYTAGMGYRWNRHLDGELKVMAGPITPTLTAGALMACAGYRF
jgi:hypothetical protein